MNLHAGREVDLTTQTYEAKDEKDQFYIKKYIVRIIA